MKKNIVLFVLAILALIPACDGSKKQLHSSKPKEVTKQEARRLEKAESALASTAKEFSSMFKVLSIANKEVQDRELKKIVFKKTQEWSKSSSWFRVSWLNFTTTLRDYKDIPFHAFEYALNKHAKSLSRLAIRLNKVKAIDVAPLKVNLKETAVALRKLSKLTGKHDRYLLEGDTICIATRLRVR